MLLIVDDFLWHFLQVLQRVRPHWLTNSTITYESEVSVTNEISANNLCENGWVRHSTFHFFYPEFVDTWTNQKFAYATQPPEKTPSFCSSQVEAVFSLSSFQLWDMYIGKLQYWFCWGIWYLITWTLRASWYQNCLQFEEQLAFKY